MDDIYFQAIEKGYKFDFGGFHEADRKRFGQLLSDMFVKYWDKTMMGSSEAPDETILKLVLSWPPFSSFLQVLSKLFIHLFMTIELCLYYFLISA